MGDSKYFQKGFATFVTGLIALVLIVIVGYIFYQTFQLKDQPSDALDIAPSPTIISNDTEHSEEPEKWTEYKHEGEYPYQISHPESWEIEEGDSFVRFLDSETREYLQLSCPRGAGEHLTNLPNPKEWENNEGGYYTKFIRYLQINGMEAVQYVWGSGYEFYSVDQLFTSLMRTGDPVVCELFTKANFSDNYVENIEKLDNYNRALNSFEYL